MVIVIEMLVMLIMMTMIIICDSVGDNHSDDGDHFVTGYYDSDDGDCELW